MRSLEEGRIYRFPSVSDALAATLVYATALGNLGARGAQARRVARRPRLLVVPAHRRDRGPGRDGRARRLALRHPAGARGGHTGGAPSTPAEAQTKLPPPWEIRVDVLNGTSTPGAATSLSNEIGGPLAYRMGTVGNAPRLDYVQTRVYYAPGSEAIAQRLADELGLEITELPSGKDPNRLLVIVGTDQAAG